MNKEINKDICPDCGQIHDEKFEELAEIMAETFTTHAFPVIWKELKNKTKEMTKKELAEEMFHLGAIEILKTHFNQMHHLQNKKH